MFLTSLIVRNTNTLNSSVAGSLIVLWQVYYAHDKIILTGFPSWHMLQYLVPTSAHSSVAWNGSKQAHS